jgi:hypothetical protein
MRVKLYEQHGATRVYIDAAVTDEGDLQVAGHDIGEAPKKWWGHDDYEYIVTIRKEDKDRLLLALMAEKSFDDPSIASFAREKDILTIREKDKDRTILALIEATFGGDGSAVSRFRDFALEKNIPYEWFTWP